MLDQDVCYEALKSHDARFDGKFFVGVSSTGVYCRPTCHARLPKRQNCTFFDTAAQAEAAGFRPCLQCRPELAPGWAPVDAERSLAHKTARLLRENCCGVGDLESFAARLGYTGRHLRRVFSEEYGVSPAQYVKTCRLLLAKQLLTETRLPVAQVAAASGFGSLRRFNQVFRDSYGMVPSDVRRSRGSDASADAVTLRLAYRPPYAWDRMIGFLQMRAIPGVEVVRDGTYYRVARLAQASDGSGDHVGWYAVRPCEGKDVALVTVSASLMDVLPQVIARVRHQFDLDCDPLSIAEGLRSFQKRCMGKFHPGQRLPGCFDPFEMSVRAVLGQQISAKGASTLAGRMARSAGMPVDVGVEGLTHAFPNAYDVASMGEGAQETLASLGIVGARVRTIRALAHGIEAGEIDLSYGADPACTLPALEALPGIGPWTAHYIAMRATGYTDAFPASDLGIKRALGLDNPKDIEKLAEDWRPWRAYATINLWCAEG